MPKDKNQIIVALFILAVIIIGVLWLRQRSLNQTPLSNESELSPSFEQLFNSVTPEVDNTQTTRSPLTPTTVTKEFIAPDNSEALGTVVFTKNEGQVQLSVTANLPSTTDHYMLWGFAQNGSSQNLGELVENKAGFLLEVSVPSTQDIKRLNITKESESSVTNPSDPILTLEL